MVGASTYPDFDYAQYAVKLLGSDPDDIDDVLNHYNISRKTLEEMIANVQEWYDKQPHLPKGQLHRRMIIAHLMTRAFSVEQTKDIIDNYFSVRRKMPDVVCGMEPPSANMTKYINQGFWIVSPLKTKDNQRIVICRLMDCTDLVVVDLFKLAYIGREYRIFIDTSIAEHWVFDLSKVTVNVVMQLTPSLLWKIYYYCTACYAPKLKGMHFVNVPSYAMSALAIFKKIVKVKHAQRIHLYEGFEKLYEVLPREVFPKDLGGTGDFTCDEIAENWKEACTSVLWRQYLKHQELYFHSDESKRVTSPKMGDTFGVEGSFRKLDLD